MKGKERGVVQLILLSIVTCGIYFIYWQFTVTEEVNAYLGENETSGGKVVLFSIITCGIYALYWIYKMGKRVAACQEKASIKSSDDSVILLVLAIFGLSIVSAAIIQSNLNKVWVEN